MENYQLANITMTVSRPVVIDFPEYDKMKEDITKLVDEMKDVTVTEETSTTYKKLLAQVRKQFSLVDKERIELKKQVLQPYNEVDEKVKELKALLDEGETHIDQQIKAYEAQQRLEREIALGEMFHKYMDEYNAPSWLDFESFKRNFPKTLNKTCSEIEKRRSIINWFESFESNYAELKMKYPVKSVRMNILAYYKTNGFNMSQAIEQYEQMVKEAERLEAEKKARKQSAVPEFSFDKPVIQEVKQVTVTLEFSSEEEYEKAMRALNLEQINYKKV